MTKLGKKILNAVSLGDGYVRARVADNSYSICICHSEKQKEYIEYKAKLVSEAVGKSVNVFEFNNSGHKAYRFEVACPYFKFVRKWLYKAKKR